MQHQLAKLSRLLLYAGIPSVLVVTFAIPVYSSGGGLTIDASSPAIVVAFSAVGTFRFVPLAIILSYLVG